MKSPAPKVAASAASPKPPRLTPQQEQALNVGNHLAVTANAGAGKTTVLVHRFLEILARTGAGVGEIVAITFTEKAANELRRKIAAQVEERIRHAPSAAERRHLEEVRDELSSATIGTIHAFCAQLLRAYPVESDVDPLFTVLEGIDQRILQHHALQEAFEEVMGEPEETPARRALIELVRMFGRSPVQEQLSTLLEKREQIERLLEGIFDERHTDGFILERWHEILSEEARRIVSRTDWQRAAENLLRVANGSTATEVARALEEPLPAATPEERFSFCHRLLETMFTQAGGFRKKFMGTGEPGPGLEEEVELLQGFREELLYLSRHFMHPPSLEGNARLLAATRLLLAVYRRCEAVYERKKSEIGVLDFEDLQLKARTLLRSSEIAGRLMQKYRFIMVDEFQDTNRLQYEILRLLVGHFSSGNLFIVGDPKQSIYGFRNAEVEVFEEARREIAASARHEQGSGTVAASPATGEGEGAVVLSESFRPLPNLVTFTNTLFGRLMGRTGSSHDVRYDELVRGRTGREGGLVEVLLVPEEAAAESAGDGEEDPRVALECRMIAGRILELVQGGHEIYEGNGSEAARNVAFRDVAILLRDRAHVRSVERALAGRAIPYVLLGGIGFYQTQEVYDLLNYFKFLLHPGDDVALAGVLRSPFHVVSDAELFEISLVNNGQTFWEKVTLYVGRPGASATVRRAVKVLSHHLECANRLTIPSLAERILQETAWRGTMSGLAEGRQYAANVKKLLRIAREFEARGYAGLFDFVERLKTLVAEQEREGQASVNPHDNCVQVMTIHSAKGLEFPVVFLPFAHKSFGLDLPPHIDADVGIGIRTRERTQPEREVVPALYAYLERRSRERVENEEKRIFYVACTRARDALLISAYRGKKTPAPTYLSWLEQGLRGLISFTRPPERVGKPHSPASPSVSLRWYSGQELRASGAAGGGESLAPPKTLLIEPLRSRISGEVYSATHIKTYLECPSKYYLKYILGLPEEQAARYGVEEEEQETEQKLFPRIEGIVAHAALQHLRSASVTDEEIAGRVGELARSHADGGSALSGDRIGAIVRSIAGFRDSPFGQEMLSATEAVTEYPVQSAFEGNFLTGTIDRLYKDAKGTWSIVDYKTDRIDRADLSARGELYKPQLLLYAYLVSRLYRQEKIRATLVFLQHPMLPLHYDFSPDQLTSHEETLRSVISRIQSQDFRRERTLCDGCPYRTGSGCLIPPG